MATPKVFSLFKLLDYTEVFPNVSTLGKKVDFYLECNTYDAMIPMVTMAEKRLDIFENAVLKMIHHKGLPVDEIAKIMCLPKDLINFIIIRLKEMELLEKDGITVSENGKEVLKVDTSVSDNVNYEQAKIFVIKKTGEILPYIHRGEFVTENVGDYSNSQLTVEYGTSGKPIKIIGKCLRESSGGIKENYLQSVKIRKAMQRFNRINSENPAVESINYDGEWAIDNTVSDNVYFHMQAVVQNGNVDEILVSDGLVENIDFVNKYINQYYPDFRVYVQEKSTQNSTDDTKIKESNYKIVNKKYRVLDKIWSYINDDFKEFESNESEENTVLSQDINRVFQGKQKKYLLNCYSAFEWIFFYYNKQNPLDSKMSKVIDMQTPPENCKTILEMLDKLGIRFNKNISRLFSNIDMDKIKRIYREEVPELRVMLGIAIIGAAKDNTSQMSRLLASERNLLNIIYDLFVEHGDLSHRTVTPEMSFERDKRIYYALKDTIRYLLPDFNFGSDADSATLENNIFETISQERLNAIVRLSKEIGSMYFNNIISRDLKNEWIQISPSRKKMPDETTYVETMYRILQDTLYQELMDIKKDSSLDKVQLIKGLGDKGVKNKVFDTVKEHFVADSLRNINGTLGSNGLVYLYYQSEGNMNELVKHGYVKLLEQLVKLRKHGSNVGLNVNVTELNNLRQMLIEITKIIGGNYNG